MAAATAPDAPPSGEARGGHPLDPHLTVARDALAREATGPGRVGTPGPPSGAGLGTGSAPPVTPAFDARPPVAPTFHAAPVPPMAAPSLPPPPAWATGAGGTATGADQAPPPLPGPAMPPYSPMPPGPAGASVGADRATWGMRAGAYLIDVGVIAGPTLVLSVLGRVAVVFAVLNAIWTLVLIALCVWIAVQVGSVGGSPGMRVVGLRCVSAKTGGLPGGGTGFLRSLYHGLLAIPCGIPMVVDLLFPLWDAQRQTLADKMAGTYVVVADKQRFSIAPPGTFGWGPFWLTGHDPAAPPR
ncbi:MAG TPA: RDD family protein [Acidimicrobiales bacterium]|nr:RDD family protein [Acidimicrobiales bacterium]